MTSARKITAITKTPPTHGRRRLSLSRSPSADGAGSARGLASMASNLSTRRGVVHIGCLGMDDLDRAVHAVVRECLGVKEGEEVLVVCNPATQRVGERLREEAADGGRRRGARGDLRARPRTAAEPPRTVAEAMAAADVLMAPTVQSLSHTAARKSGHRGRGADARRCPG